MDLVDPSLDILEQNFMVCKIVYRQTNLYQNLNTYLFY